MTHFPESVTRHEASARAHFRPCQPWVLRRLPAELALAPRELFKVLAGARTAGTRQPRRISSDAVIQSLIGCTLSATAVMPASMHSGPVRIPGSCSAVVRHGTFRHGQNGGNNEGGMGQSPAPLNRTPRHGCIWARSSLCKGPVSRSYPRWRRPLLLRLGPRGLLMKPSHRDSAIKVRRT